MCLCGVGVGFTVSVWGVQGFGLVMFGAPGTALPRTVPGPPFPGPPFPWTPFSWTAQNFAFFSLSRRKIRSFLPSLGVFSLNLWCFEDWDPQMCTFGLSDSKRAHLSAPALQTPPKFHEKTPREGRKEGILRRDREKKREILGPPPIGPPTHRPPTLRAPTLRPSPPLGAPLRAPTPSGPTHVNSKHTKKT